MNRTIFNANKTFAESLEIESHLREFSSIVRSCRMFFFISTDDEPALLYANSAQNAHVRLLSK